MRAAHSMFDAITLFSVWFCQLSILPQHPACDNTLDHLDLSLHMLVCALLHRTQDRPVMDGSDQSSDRQSDKESANEKKKKTNDREEMDKHQERKG